MSQKRLDFVTRYLRGDDSVLNNQSSAERRYLEGIGIILAVDAGSKALGLSPEGLKMDIMAAANQIFPEAVPGGNGGLFDTIKAGAMLGPQLFGLTTPGVGTVAQLAQGDIVGAGLASMGPLGAGAALYGDIKQIQTRPSSDSSAGGVNSSLKIPLRDVLVAALTAGYLMEKASGPIQGLGQAISGVGAVKLK